MKNSLLLLVSLLGSFVLLISCASEEPTWSTEEYSWGMLQNDLALHTVPTGDRYGDLLAISVRLPAGQVFEREGEAGFSSLATRVLAASQLATEPGTRFFIENQEDAIYLSVEFLKSELDVALEQLVPRLSPVVNEEELNAFRQQLLSTYQANQQNPNQKIRDTVNSLLYPRTALARDVEDRIADVEAATAETVQEYIGRTVRPEKATAVLSGALDREVIRRVVESLGTWTTSAPEPLPASLPSVEEVSAAFRIIDVDRNETEFYMLRSLPTPSSIDYYPMRALNYIFNGTVLGSRLAMLNDALAGQGSLQSVLNLQSVYAGQIIFGRVPVASALEVVSATRTQLELLISGTVNEKRILEQELLDARNYLSNSLLRNTQTQRQLNAFVLWADDYGFENPLPSQHVERIRQMSEADLIRALDTYHADDEIINALVLAGPEQRLEAQFEGW